MISTVKRYLSPRQSPANMVIYGILLLAVVGVSTFFVWKAVMGAKSLDAETKRFEIWVTNHTAHKYGRVNLLNMELNSIHSISPGSGFTNATALNLPNHSLLVADTKAVEISDATPEDIDESVQTVVLETSTQNEDTIDVKLNAMKGIPARDESIMFQDSIYTAVTTQNGVEVTCVGVVKEAQLGTDLDESWSNNESNTQLLENSAPEGGAAHPNRGLKFYQVGEILALSASTTGEVWVLQSPLNDSITARNTWKVVPSTLNGWQPQDNTPLEGESSAEQTHNICPRPEDVSVSEFGVRPNRVNVIPLTIGVRDPNPQDEVFITSIEVSQDQVIRQEIRQESAQSSSQEGAFSGVEISDNRKSVVTKVADVISGYMHIIAHITDAGADAKGVCDSVYAFDVYVHPLDQNSPPLQAGRAPSADDLTFYSANSTITQNVLDSWLDPDGDDLALVNVTSSAHLQAISSPGGESTIRHIDDLSADENLNLNYQVVDSFNARASGGLGFLVKSREEYIPQNYTVFAQKGSKQMLDLSAQSQRLGGKVVLKDIQCQDTIRCTGVGGDMIEIIASSLGVYTLSYSFEGVKASGAIRLHVLEVDEGLMRDAKSLVVTLMDVSDTMLDLSEAFSGLRLSQQASTDGATEATDANIISNCASIKNVEAIPQLTDGGPNARIDAEQVAPFELHIGGQVLMPMSAVSGVVFAGWVQITWRYGAGGGGGEVGDIDTAREITQRITVLIEASPDQSIIVNDDFADVAPGEVIEVDVLKNDYTAYAANALVDDSQTFDQDLTQGIAYVHGSKIRYIAPDDMPKQVVIPYAVYIKGYYITSRASGYLTITKRDVLVDANSNNDDPLGETGGNEMSNIEGDASYLTPFGRYSQVYYNEQPEVSLDLQDDIFTPSYVKLQFDKPALQQLQSGGEKDGSPDFNSNPAGITLDDESFSAQIDNAKVKIPATGLLGTSVWEVKVSAYCALSPLSDGGTSEHSGSENPVEDYGESRNLIATDVCIDGDLLSVYTHYIVLRRTVEPSPAIMPYTKDYSITTYDLQNRHHFAKDMAPFAFGFQGPVQFEKLGLRGFGGASTSFSGNVLEGDLDERVQILVYKVSESEVSAAKTRAYGMVRIFAKHSITPKRSDLEVLQVKAGSTLRIPLEDRVQKLADADLVTIGDARRMLEYLPANCYVKDGVLVYETSGEIYEEAQDECIFTARFSTEDAIARLAFKVRIIPQNTTPELKDGVVLAGLAPKGSAKMYVSDKITWVGHTLSDIENLTLKCVGDVSVSVDCNNTELDIKIDRNAQESSVHEIHLELEGYQVTAKWKIRILKTEKTKDLDLGEHFEEVVVTQNSGSAQVDVSKAIYELWESEKFFGVHTGAYVKCGAIENPYLKCSDGAKFGVLTFWVENAPEGGGFETKATYTFADRQDINDANSGVGYVRVKYRSLPKTPSNIKVNAEVASTGAVQIDVSDQEPYSSPAPTQYCLNIIELRTQVCKQSFHHAATFNSADTLSMLGAWNTYTFSAYSINDVGSSNATNSIVASPFTPLMHFNIYSQVIETSGGEDLKCIVQISNIDTNIVAWSAQSLLGEVVFSNVDELKAYLETTSKQAETDVSVKVTAKARRMLFTGADITPMYKVDFLLPSTWQTQLKNA